MSSFGENLKQIRLKRNMSQDEFAALLKTSKQVISRYETGQRSPKVSVVGRFAEILGVPITQLTGGESQLSPSSSSDVWAAREALRRDPDRRALLNLAEKGTTQDVRQVAALIDALRATNPEFGDYDDDPA